MHSVAGILILISFLFTLSMPAPVQAASGDETTAGVLTLTPTIECIGVIVSFTGDNNQNNTVIMEYRPSGGSWQPGMMMYADRRPSLAINGVDTPNPLRDTWRASILGLTLFPTIGSIIGLILGYMARNQIRDSGGTIGGEGLAKAGIILGWIGVALAVLGVCLVILVWVGLIGGSLGLTICGGLGNTY